MHKDNAVLRQLNAVGSNACRAALIAAMTFSMVPTAAFAQKTETGSEATNNAPISIQSERANPLTSDSNKSNTAVSTSYDLAKIKDGTYTGTAEIPDNEDDEWAGYTVTVNVTVSNHKIIGVEVKNNGEVGNQKYVNWAVSGRANRNLKGVPEQIVAANGTSNIDTVSGATFTSDAIKAAVDSALQAAHDEQNPATPAADEYTYGYAALTWAEYWAGENVQAAGNAASSDELDSRGESDKGAFDVVTRATANHGLHRGSYQCSAVIQTKEGATFDLATWAADGKSFTTTDGKTVAWNRGAMTCDGESYTLEDYEVTGLKYIPVKVKTADLEAFKATHAFVANGETLAGGYGEGNLKAYSGLVADVDANTNGLKTVTMSNGTASFSSAATGTDSGIKDQDLKTATGIEPTVRDASGSYGEFLRVDLNGDYGDLGANMQSVTWTYYGDDATYSNALATYGTKFAADNWMHKSMGIQLGLTKSERCQLPEGTNGTGYWKLTVHALGYNDYVYEFQAAEDNIVGAKQPVSEETKAELQKLYDKAAALNKDDYTAESWANSSIETETAETKDLLTKEDLSEAEATEQLTHLQSAIDALVKDGVSAGDYLLMNVPYAELYAADTTNNDTKVDVFTSATKAKAKTGKLAGGSYGGISNDADGSAKTTQISGAQFPVKVSAAAAKKIKAEKLTQVTDKTSVDVTTTNRGHTSTTTYTGKKALFAESDWAYYQLAEEPSFYKELDVDADGNFVLSGAKGTAPEVISGTAASLKTETSYGDYQLDLDGAAVESKFDHETDFIYTVLVNTTDGTSYGMRPLENVWLGNELAWCSTDLVKSVHNCPTSYEHYASLMGKTIKSVTYYTEKGAFTFELANPVKVPLKASKSELNVEATDVTDGAYTEVTTTLPEDFKPSYLLDGEPTEIANGRVSFNGTKPGKHTLTVRDTSGTYADISAEFTLSTDKVVAAFDERAAKIVPSGLDDDATTFIANISSVNVNGTDYSASGRGSVTIINKDGSLNLDATTDAQGGGRAGGTKVFGAYGTYTIKVTSTGYNKPLEFTYTLQADRSALTAKIDEANRFNEDRFTAASWKALSDALAQANEVNANVEATDGDINQAANALDSAIAGLAERAEQEQKDALAEEIAAGAELKESDYTADSWKAYAAALAKAKELAASEDPAGSDIAAATEALHQARENLAKPSVKPAEPGKDGSGTTTTTTTVSQAKESSKANASKGDLPGTGDAQGAVAGIVIAAGAALAAGGAALRRRFQH